MSLRHWEFGYFDHEAAEFDGDFISGRSILVWSNDTNQEEPTIVHNPEYGEVCRGDGASAFTYALLASIGMTQVKSVMGQIPVLVRVQLSCNLHSSATSAYFNVRRMYVPWDVGDATNRYKDKSLSVPWWGDAYAPFYSRDVATDESDRTGTQAWTGGGVDRFSLDITPELALALRNNDDLRLYVCGWIDGSFINVNWKPPVTTRRPLLIFDYLYPVEFYQDDGGGNIDYSSPVQEAEDGHYYLGAVERGSTGSAVKCHLRNYTEGTQQVEIFDDHPEWTTPVQRVGTGTGQLDYVTLADSSLSQLYTVVFYSATEFEVKAEAYRDNATSYHPQINADASWRGSTASDFTTPSGGLTIPAAAWQASGIASSDEYEVGVRGNTTDTTWPPDSNDQVEVTNNVAGLPDSGGWRPVLGRREQLTNTVAVDATSVFVPVRHIVPAEWPVDTPCFMHSKTSIDEGTVVSTQERALAAASHSGTGDDDLTVSGNYNGNENRTYRVQIDAEGSPDTFSWSRDGTTTWVATGVAITGSPQLLESGVWLDFGGTDNHTLGDYWTFDADTWGLTVGGLTIGANTYAAGAIVATTLPVRDMTVGASTRVSQASGVSETLPSRLYMDDTTGFTEGASIFVTAAATGNYESKVIATGGVTATYVDLTTAMVYDYAEGDFVTKTGSGEDAFWARPVANTTTVEQLKRLRFNARIL